jgi:hypothetical protein
MASKGDLCIELGCNNAKLADSNLCMAHHNNRIEPECDGLVKWYNVYNIITKRAYRVLPENLTAVMCAGSGLVILRDVRKNGYPPGIRDDCPWDPDPDRVDLKECLKYAHENGCPSWSIKSSQTITDAPPNTSNVTLTDTVHKNDELNNLVDMHLDQINQMETALHNAKDNFLTLKQNYERLQQEFYILKDAYDKKCSNDNNININEKYGIMTITLKFENISNLKSQLDAKDETINNLHEQLAYEKIRHERITTILNNIIMQ